jgi:hypothetical protein
LLDSSVRNIGIGAVISVLDVGVFQEEAALIVAHDRKVWAHNE